MVGLTATATRAVQADIIERLWGSHGRRPGREPPRLHTASLLRSNLHLTAERCPTELGRLNRLAECLAVGLADGGKALVYCGTRSRAARVATALVENKRLAAAAGLTGGPAGVGNVVLYHAGLSDRERQRAQEEFLVGVRSAPFPQGAPDHCSCCRERERAEAHVSPHSCMLVLWCACVCARVRVRVHVRIHTCVVHCTACILWFYTTPALKSD